jgi:hypothetical protein
MGFPPELIAQLEQVPDPADSELGIWPENWPIVSAFAGICGQWRVVGLSTMAGARLSYIGLDYAGVRAGLVCARIRITSELWDGIRIMEAAMRSELNK